MPENEHPEMRDRVLEALALARASGVPWLATMARVQPVATGDASAVELRIGYHGPSGAGLVGVAMLADLALGAALRSQVGARRALPTLTLTLELDPEPPRPWTSVRARSEPPRGGLGRTHGTVLSGETVVGRCLATFAVPGSAARLDPLPWEVPEAVTPLVHSTAEPLTDAEQAVLTAMRTLDAEHGRPWADALLAKACQDGPDGRFLHPNAAMLNRSGQVQGAVLFWFAAASSEVDGHLVSGHIQFLTPADPWTSLLARPVAVHETRRTVFVHTEVSQRGQPVASADFVFRRAERNP
ncbi:PaaI family thioesterase [Actinomadura luteofluorescens]